MAGNQEVAKRFQALAERDERLKHMWSQKINNPGRCTIDLHGFFVKEAMEGLKMLIMVLI